MPSDDNFFLWEPCPVCDGTGGLDVSAPEEPPDSCVLGCWRCHGAGGWPVDEDVDGLEEVDDAADW